MPTISFLQSDQNRTFNTNNVTLSLNLNKPVSQITYNLDNEGNLLGMGVEIYLSLTWLTVNILWQFMLRTII